jgi:hypothetical protein
MLRRIVCVVALVAGVVAGVPRVVGAAAVPFTLGHYFTTTNGFSNFGISEYGEEGGMIRRFAAPAVTRGLAFGSDGLLYVVGIPSNPSQGFVVNAIDATGAVQRSYAGPDYYFGNTTYGHIAVDDHYVYTAGQDNLTRFERNNPAARNVIFTGNQVFDVDVLPWGNLLVATAYSVSEITPEGQYVRNIPYGGFTDIRSAEYDPATGAAFVAHFGNTGTPTRMYKFDYASGTLLKESPEFALDLFLTRKGELLANGPRLFTTDLNRTGLMDGNTEVFVTQFVPEPAGATLAAAIAGAALLLRPRRPVN